MSFPSKSLKSPEKKIVVLGIVVECVLDVECTSHLMICEMTYDGNHIADCIKERNKEERVQEQGDG